jgi:hypothetical protein
MTESERLWSILPVLPTDYSDFGGEVVRWADPSLLSNDCSQSCKWARFIEDGEEGDPSLDWLVCTSPTGPRRGLLTFEHMAGEGCWEMDPVSENE